MINFQLYHGKNILILIMVLYATFNNISIILWWSVLLVEETRVPSLNRLVPPVQVPPFIFTPADHVITGDLNIINNTSLQDVYAKGQKYREPKSINWKQF